MISICMINQKGGCGKSTMCFNLAGAMLRGGLSVLLIDADPQGSLSQGYFGSQAVESLPLEQTLAALFDDETPLPSPEVLIHQTEIEGLAAVRANQHLARFNKPQPETTGMRQHALGALMEAAERFDVVLIDCPPNLYMCSWAALVASHHVLIPVPPEDFGAQGLRAVHQAIDQARLLNPALRLLGHVITRRDRRLLVHGKYENRIREHLDESVLESVIPELAAYKTAVSCRAPVEFTEPGSDAAAAMRACCSETLQRIVEVRPIAEAAN